MCTAVPAVVICLTHWTKSRFPFCNTSLTYDERVYDLISRLTLEEKPLLLTARESPSGQLGAPIDSALFAFTMLLMQVTCRPLVSLLMTGIEQHLYIPLYSFFNHFNCLGRFLFHLLCCCCCAGLTC